MAYTFPQPSLISPSNRTIRFNKASLAPLNTDISDTETINPRVSPPVRLNFQNHFQIDSTPKGALSTKHNSSYQFTSLKGTPKGPAPVCSLPAIHSPKSQVIPNADTSLNGDYNPSNPSFKATFSGHFGAPRDLQSKISSRPKNVFIKSVNDIGLGANTSEEVALNLQAQHMKRVENTLKSMCARRGDKIGSVNNINNDSQDVEGRSMQANMNKGYSFGQKDSDYGSLVSEKKYYEPRKPLAGFKFVAAPVQSKSSEDYDNYDLPKIRRNANLQPLEGQDSQIVNLMTQSEVMLPRRNIQSLSTRAGPRDGIQFIEKVETIRTVQVRKVNGAGKYIRSTNNLDGDSLESRNMQENTNRFVQGRLKRPSLNRGPRRANTGLDYGEKLGETDVVKSVNIERKRPGKIETKVDSCDEINLSEIPEKSSCKQESPEMIEEIFVAYSKRKQSTSKKLMELLTDLEDLGI